jgi:hypothetical protein
MASASMQGTLTNLTVPLGADGQPPNQGLLMPKLKYRFRVTFDQFGLSGTTELTKQVMDFKRPSVTFADIDVPVYNSTIKLAGKYTWDNVTCTLRDDASNGVTKIVGEQLQKQLDFMEQSSASAGIDYKFTTKFEVLDGGNGNGPGPIALETWYLYGCYLQGVDYGNADYSSNEVMTLALTIRFDNALQQDAGVGTPSPVPGQRTNGAATG